MCKCVQLIYTCRLCYFQHLKASDLWGDVQGVETGCDAKNSETFGTDSLPQGQRWAMARSRAPTSDVINFCEELQAPRWIFEQVGPLGQC